MNLGISTWGFFYQRDPATWSTLAGAVDDVLAMDEGLGVEVWGSRSFEEPPVAGKDLVKLVAACREAEFVTVHTQGRYWSWHPVGLRREIDFAHQLGAETLVLHPVCLGLEQPEDRPDWPEIVRIAEYAAKFGVRSIPTLLVFKDGQEVERFVGVQQAVTLVQAIESQG